MPEHHFETPSPVDLYVEVGKGNVHIRCTETTESTVLVEGRGADEVLVEQSGHQIRVVEPRRSGLFRDTALRVEVTVPDGSSPTVRTGSADIAVQGNAGEGQLRSGSGDVTVDSVAGRLLVETGSGDIKVEDVRGDLRVKSGSGDVRVGHAGGSTNVSTGSGDVDVDTAAGATVVKTGSGDLHVGTTEGDVAISTGSGDLVVDRVPRGRVTAKGASGDVRVGVPAGVPVWTDVTTVSGSIHSELQGAGQPQEGQDHVELRAKTVSGDIVLVEV